MPHHVPKYTVVRCTVPRREIWKQAITMSVGLHLYRLLGPQWANLYLSFFMGLLINIIGLNSIREHSYNLYSQWLIQHFKRLREHQGWAARQHEDNEYNIRNAIEVCKGMELESLLSYPHEHTKTCRKDCMLRHGDIFIIFGQYRAAPLTPRYARNKLAGRDLEFVDDVEDKANETDTDLDTGMNTPKTDDEGIKGTECGTSKTQEESPGVIESLNQPGQDVGAGSDRADYKHKAPEVTDANITQPPEPKEISHSFEGRVETDVGVYTPFDPSLYDDIDDEVPQNTTEGRRLLVSSPDDKASDSGGSDVTITGNSAAKKEGTASEKPEGEESEDEQRESETQGSAESPSPPKVKGPAPQKKKPKKKW